MAKIDTPAYLIKITMVIVATLMVFVIIGIIAPKALISNNLNSFEGERYLFALYTLQSARSFIGGSLEPLFHTQFRILEIREVNEESRRCSFTLGGNEKAYTLNKNYKATVQGYTFFGIPYTKIEIGCEGSVRI